MVELEVFVRAKGSSDSISVAAPTRVDIAAALHALDGEARNEVYLHASSGPWMAIGGGFGRVMVIYAESEEGPFSHAATTHDDVGETHRLRVAGEDTEVPDRFLLPVDRAIDAAIEFAVSESRPPCVEWE